MKTYGIADLHGRFDLFLEAVHLIEKSSHTGGTIVFLGDYVDRGPQSAQIIQALIDGPSEPDRWQWVTLQGNHEDMMVESLRTKAQFYLSNWCLNGGGRTLISYGADAARGALAAVDCVPQEHIDFIANMPVTYQDKHRFFVHGGMPPEGSTYKQTLQWYLFKTEDDYPTPDGLHIVHGHHQHTDGPLLYKNRSNFDTGAYHTGRLVIGVFDDDTPGGPIATHEIKL